MRRAIETYARCLQTGEWPGYPSGTQIISVLPWAYSEDDIEMKAV
jgi:hypothetical protein